MVMISQRLAEAEDRAIPGHWEGDLLVGALGQSAIVTLVERHTRYVMLAWIGRDKSSAHVCAVLARRIRTLPEHLIRSLTCAPGSEAPTRTRTGCFASIFPEALISMATTNVTWTQWPIASTIDPGVPWDG
jgi:IS30 family transposase